MNGKSLCFKQAWEESFFLVCSSFNIEICYQEGGKEHFLKFLIWVIE